MRLNRNKIVVCVLSISIVLQVVAFLTPGWIVFKGNTRSEYQGLLYKVVCHVKGECITTSAINENTNSGVWFQGVSFIIKCLLPLILSAVALVLQILSMRQPKKKSQNYVSCLICVTMSAVAAYHPMKPLGFSFVYRLRRILLSLLPAVMYAVTIFYVVLQWDLVFLHTFLPQERDNASSDFIFPWCRTMEAICGACSIGCSLLFMSGLRKALKAYETAQQGSTENANDVTEDETKVVFEC